MKHLGDITKINGSEVPRVYVVIGGSPCQDLSIAGQRAGLGGARSGLFMEQIRIIKEMRKKDIESGRTGEDVFPRFMLWENVPGAFSSNGGEDFRAVLEETARIADENAIIPRPAKGKWTPAGGIVGDGWSIAWRVLDAQFWGVPQRRRRIALVADFGNWGGAFQILFERKNSSWGIGKSSEKTSENTKFDKGSTVECSTEKREFNTIYDISHSCDVLRVYEDVSPTLTTRAGTGGNQVPLVLDRYDGVIRKITPLECERLQGYPDGWTDIGDWTDGKGKVHKCSDAARYKALGNSIALPQWRWILGRMSELCVERTMASLFDGIGGFPLIWEELNGKDTCLWASEIEEFPIAVTTKRFNEGENDAKQEDLRR